MAKVHIGKKIKEVLDRSSMKSTTEFARKINLTRDGVYKIFNKESIATDQLQKISEVLEHDFFSYYQTHFANEQKSKYGFASKEDVEVLTRLVNALAKQLEKMQQDLDDLAQAKKPTRKKSR